MLKGMLLACLLLTSALSIFAQSPSKKGSSQPSKITVNLSNVPLKEVLSAIQKASNYRFLYNTKLIDESQKVSVSATNEDVLRVVDELFSGLDIQHKVMDKQIVLSPKSSRKIAGDGLDDQDVAAHSGNRIVKGRVVDDKGEAIPGVSIMVQGTSFGAVTTADGFFLIKVPEGKKHIKFSFIGYTPVTLTVTEKESYNVVMVPDSKRLDEVVVTGYQKISKERASGAFVKVNTESLEKKTTANILDKLEGQTSGVLFDSKGNISIRGISTMRAESKPLVVVDGFPIEGSIETINPNDIESITVLKDAAAASIWGARAANGVIVIVSKRTGEKGAPRVELSSSVSVTDQPDLFDLPIASTKSFLEMEKFLADNKWQSLPFGSSQYPLTQGIDAYLKLNAGKITQAEADNIISSLQNVDVRKEFNDLFLRNSVRSQYDLSISGRGDRNFYYMSLNYNDNQSISKGNENDRLITTLRLSSDISKRIKVNAGLSASIRNTLSNGMGLNMLSNIPQYQRILDDNGGFIPQPKTYYQSTKEGLVAKGYPYNWDYNLYQEYLNKDSKAKNTDLKMNLGVSINILEGLDFDGGVQYEWGSSKSRNLSNENTYYVRDMVNTFTTISNGSVVTNMPKGSIVSEAFGNYDVLTSRGQLNLDRSFNEGKHAINAIAGVEVRKLVSEGTGLTKYGFDPQSLQFVTINSNTMYPTAISGQRRVIGDPTSFSYEENRFLSYYGNAAYTYDEKYTLTASARLDDSNLFGADTKYRNVPLWSAGLNWQLHKEDFFKLSFIDRLNLRMTYGTNGNVDKSTSPYLIANVTKDYNDQHQYAYVMNPQNPNLRWEKTSVVNFGIDYSMFNSRVTGSLEYYSKYSKDLLGNVSLNSTYGFQSALMNTAEMSNKGIDWNINVLVVDKAIKWNTGFNLSYNKNVVEKVDMPSKTIMAYLQGSPMVGKPLNYMYSYRWAGLSSTGAPQIYNEKNEKIDFKSDLSDVAALVYEGTTIPKYYGNFQNDFSYKGVRLSVMMTYKFGYVFRTPSISYYSLQSVLNRYYIPEEFDNRWRKPGDENVTDVPKMPENFAELNGKYDSYSSSSSKTVEDASHIRLKEIILSYDLPKSVISPLRLKSLNLGVQARNVAVILFNKSGIDPEASPFMLGYGLPVKPEITFSLKAVF